jgi:hypothetical protein
VAQANIEIIDTQPMQTDVHAFNDPLGGKIEMSLIVPA